MPHVIHSPDQRHRNLALTIAIVRDGRTRGKLADDAGVTASTLSAFLTGRMRPSESAKARLAATLGYPVAALFGADAYEVES